MFGKCDSVSLNENALKTITPFPSDRSCQRQLLKDKVLFLARILFISETILHICNTDYYRHFS